MGTYEVSLMVTDSSAASVTTSLRFAVSVKQDLVAQLQWPSAGVDLDRATRTGKLSDVLEIERELARVREEIERMEGRLRYLKAHVATSSLTVTVHEPAPVVGETGSGGVIADAFRDAWRNFVHFIAGLIASLGVLVPAGVLLVLGLLGLRWFWRRRHG